MLYWELLAVCSERSTKARQRQTQMLTLELALLIIVLSFNLFIKIHIFAHLFNTLNPSD